MTTAFRDRVQSLLTEQEHLLSRPNLPEAWTDGLYRRYHHPVLTAAHVPVAWRYDLREDSNPLLLARIGANSVFNAGAILHEGRYLLCVRVEGMDRKSYFAMAESPNGVDGFTIAGHGTINGNGRNYWEEFWIRRKYNRKCTNLEAMRPRLVYISNAKNVTVQDVRLINSPFWTNHLYKSENIRYLDCYIYAPTSGIKAPSSDAIDLDVCKNVLIRGCYMSVNDDAVVLKGGKGTWADKDPDNGPCSNIIIEDCTYGKVHGCLTLGSESLHDRNVILRRCTVTDANRVLWLKMRPDTPQHYEYVTVEDMTGNCSSFLVVRPWTQFFKPEKRDDMPLSTCNNITIRNIKMDCKNFFDVGKSDKYRLTDFSFEDCDVTDQKNAFDKTIIENCRVDNLRINGKKVE